MATIRKYIFWIDTSGVKTYKFSTDNSYVLLKINGQAVFSEGLSDNFWDKFDNNTAILDDEYIDFCFLSDTEIHIPWLPYQQNPQTTWNKKQIIDFCTKYIKTSPCYRINYYEGKYFIAQSGNVIRDSDITDIYVKCLPELTIDDEADYRSTQGRKRDISRDTEALPAPRQVVVDIKKRSEEPSYHHTDKNIISDEDIPQTSIDEVVPNKKESKYSDDTQEYHKLIDVIQDFKRQGINNIDDILKILRSKVECAPTRGQSTPMVADRDTKKDRSECEPYYSSESDNKTDKMPLPKQEAKTPVRSRTISEYQRTINYTDDSNDKEDDPILAYYTKKINNIRNR